MGTTVGSLYERVDELIESHKQEPLLSTTGTRAAIGELTWRSVGLEEAIREIALEIQRREDSEEANERRGKVWRSREAVNAADRVRQHAVAERAVVGRTGPRFG